MTWSAAAGIALLAVAGFLVGGAYTTWRTARPLAAVLAAGALLAAGAGVAWLL